ncbi:MAG: hypothetical protein O7F71_07200 [Gammaproteobacteria bacterium]|nr:hypothetical protein [Gammaproteobacteria bacterium]
MYRRLDTDLHSASLLFNLFDDYQELWDDILAFLHANVRTVAASIDIKPDSDPNSINLCSNGAIPIALLGSDKFNVYQVATGTLEFAEAAVKVVGKKDPYTLCSYEDVNGDFFDDLVCHYLTTDIAGVDGESTEASVTGTLVDTTPFQGTDNINIVKDSCD